MIYGIKVLVPFDDIESGKRRNIGEIFETENGSRARNIFNRGLGELVFAKHNGKKGKRVLIHQTLLYRIGGIETANRQIARAFPDRDITFIFERADQTQLLEIAKTQNVILDDGKSRYEADVLIFSNYDSAPKIINRVKAGKVYQLIHADFKGLKAMPEWRHFKWSPNEKVDRVFACSETAKRGLKEALGVESTVLPNILNPAEEGRKVFLVLSRASREKGIERVLDMVDRFEAAGKDFVLFLCSTTETLPRQYQDRIKASRKILTIPPSPYSLELLRSADYLVQLSLNESYCYSVREALQQKVPCIVSDIPELSKLIKDGKNGYVLKDDLSNLNIDKIFNKKLKLEAYREEINPLWEKVLEGEL